MLYPISIILKMRKDKAFMTHLTLANVLHALARDIEWDMQRQVMDENSPLYGTYIPLDSGLDDISHGGGTRFLASCGLLVVARQTHPDMAPATPATDTLLHRMSIMADYMLKAQRPSGLMDLRSTNYDSPPDTGFVVQLLCALVELGRGEPLLADVLAKVETFIRRAAPGMMTGGFHTPNHRWVIAGALAQTGTLFPDIDVRDAVQAYIAEGFDIDAEGTYLERSVGVYDAVTNRSLLLFADNWHDAGDIARAHTAVTENLTFNLHLLHADATAETGLSRRQDYGIRSVPVPLIATFLHSNAISPNPQFVRAAQWLWEKASSDEVSNLAWQTYTLLKFGEPAPSSASLPDHFIKHYPINAVWRVRRDQLSATVFGDVTRLMTLVYGAAELNSLKISQTYFGVGWFIGDSMRADGDTAVLRSEGQQKAHRPGYELPTGKPAPRDQWDAINAQRDWNPLPPALSELAITATETGFDLHYHTLDGLDQVAAQIALDFPAGGLWETEDTACTTQPGQVIFLKHGTGQMRFGNDVIEIGPGANAHMYQQMRHAEPPVPGMCRVLLTFVTPVDHRFFLRVFSGLQP
ncbi:MAG: hypothetical protein CL610_25990 [Anaerolineaceae bacterium]|nr:hypothetical protein [Anaerolineaceae bacterium]